MAGFVKSEIILILIFVAHRKIDIMTDKAIFLDWLKDKTIPVDELDMELIQKDEFKFENDEVRASDKTFIQPQQLDNAFLLIQRALTTTSTS